MLPGYVSGVPDARALSYMPKTHCGAAAGVPFRETHHMSGAAVKMAEDKGCQLSDLTVADLATINPLFTEDVVEVMIITLSTPCFAGDAETI